MKTRRSSTAHLRDPNFRTRIIARDGYACAQCFRFWNAIVLRWYAWRGRHLRLIPRWVLRYARNVEADHITALCNWTSGGNPNELSNGWVLCRRHHRRKTRVDLRQARGQARRYPSPALILLTTGVLSVAGVMLTSSLPRTVWLLLPAALVFTPICWLERRRRARRRARVRLYEICAKQTGLPCPTLRDSTPEALRVTRRQTRKFLKVAGWRRVTPAGHTRRRWEPERFMLCYPGSLPDHDPAVQASVEAAVTGKLTGRWSALWYPEADRVIFTAHRPMPEMVPYQPHTVSPMRLYLGEGETGPAYLDFAVTPHCLIVGPTGTGKTTCIRTVVTSALLAGWEVRICDPKRIEHAAFSGLPNVTVTTDLPDMLNMILTTRQEMDNRYRRIEHNLDPGPRVLLVIDEAAGLIDAAKEAHSKSGDPPVVAHLGQLARLARSAGIRLCVGIQRPDAKFLTGEARDNYGARISCGPLSPEGSRMVFGDTRTGQQVEDHPGRVLADLGAGPTRVQIAFLPAADLDQILGAVEAVG